MNSNYRQLYGIKAVEEIQKEGEMEQEQAANGNTSGINAWLTDAKGYVESAQSTAKDIKKIFDMANGIGQTVYNIAKGTADSVKRQQIDQYLAGLSAMVDAAEMRLKNIKREKWMLFGKVSAGCIAVGTIAYVALKK